GSPPRAPRRTVRGARPPAVELRQPGDRAEHRRGPVPARPQLLLLDRRGVLTMRTHDTKAIVALTVAGALAVGACDFNITNPSSPPPCGSNATADQIKACAVGVLVALRVDVPRIVLNGAILGREGYRLDTADPRFTSELLEGPLDPSNDAFGGGQWATEFRTIPSGYTILNVIASAGITSGQKDAVRGFVHTIQP